jgi:hypothetical protein
MCCGNSSLRALLQLIIQIHLFNFLHLIVHILKILITGFLTPITQILVTAATIKAVQSTTVSCTVRYMALSSIGTNFIALCHRPKPKTKQDDDNYEKYAIMNGK